MYRVTVRRHTEDVGSCDGDGDERGRTPESVRRAMAELDHKSRLLHEERDYYTALFTTSHRAFEDHRRELQHLLGKEREAARRAEEQLEAELARLRQENKELAARVDHERAHATSRLSLDLEQLQRDSVASDQRLRMEIDRIHTEFLEQRRQAQQLREQVDSEVHACLDLKRREESLKVRVQRLTEDSYLRATREPLRVPTGGDGGDGAEGGRRLSPRRVPVPFVPSGSTKAGSKRELAVPSSHNVHALIQTVRKANYRSPPRVRPEELVGSGVGLLREPPALMPNPNHAVGANTSGYSRTHSTASQQAHYGDPSQLRAMKQSLTAELEELRTEYDSISKVVGDPTYVSAGIARRLRTLFDQIESKGRQLDAVQSAQQRLDAAFRLSRMMDDSARLNHEASVLHTSMMNTVHSKST
jgi:hypothetical protein